MKNMKLVYTGKLCHILFPAYAYVKMIISFIDNLPEFLWLQKVFSSNPKRTYLYYKIQKHLLANHGREIIMSLPPIFPPNGLSRESIGLKCVMFYIGCWMRCNIVSTLT